MTSSLRHYRTKTLLASGLLALAPLGIAQAAVSPLDLVGPVAEY